jgi:hypothetical protein
MAKKTPEAPLDYEDEGYEEEIEEEEYEEEAGTSWKTWAIIGAVGVIVVCLALGIVGYMARDSVLAPVAAMFATETATPSVTPLPTATFTMTPTSLPSDTPEPPTNTPEPSPTPLLLPPPEVMAIVDGAPTLNEQFDDNAHSWTGLTQGAEYTIQEGNMVFKSGQPGAPGVIYCVTDCGPYEERYFYQGQMVDERGSEGGYGLVFGLDQQRSTYYVFAVRPTKGTFGLFKVSGQQIFPLQDWTQSSAIQAAPQVNVLGVRYLSGKIDMFVNGTWVSEKMDKNNPYKSGRVGLFVDQDGVRLLANQVKVFNLIEVTPEPLGQHPTSAPVEMGQVPQATAAGGGTPPPAQPGQAAQPTAPAAPTATRPAPTAGFTPTPTAYGSCGPNIPPGKWALVLTKQGNPNQYSKPLEVKINGVTYKATQMITAFYLDIKVNYVVQIGNKTFEFYYDTCKIVYKKVSIN